MHTYQQNSCIKEIFVERQLYARSVSRGYGHRRDTAEMKHKFCPCPGGTGSTWDQ